MASSGGAVLAHDDFVRAVNDLPSWKWPATWRWAVQRGGYLHVPGQVAARARTPLEGTPLGHSVQALVESELCSGVVDDCGACEAPEPVDGPDDATLALSPGSGNWATVVVGYDPSYAVPALYLRCSDQGPAQGRS